MEKVTYMGKQVWPKRNKKGEYAHKGAAYMPYINGAAIVGFGVFLVMNSGVKIEYEATPVAHASVISTSTPVSLEEKVEQVKQDLLDEMVFKCEYPGYKQETAFPTVDDNKAGTLPAKDKISYPPMQFKVSTVQRFYKILHGKQLSNYEAITLAMNEKEARALAIDSWINIKGSINEWSCATDSMKAKVEIIRELTK